MSASVQDLTGHSGPASASPRDRLRAFSERHRSLSVFVGMSLVALILPVVVLLPPFSGFSGQNVWLDGFTIAGIYVLLAMGLNMVVGMAGLLDLGYAAFFAIGSYTFAFSASSFTGLDFPFWPMLLVGAVVAAVFGVLLGAPTLRLRGDYLAIVTLGFGEIVPIVILNSSKYTEGPNGIGGISAPTIGDFSFPSVGNPWPFYLTMIALITLTMALIYRIQESRLGRAWTAIREDELAASANGVNTVTAKLFAFALGASLAGFAGVFSAVKAHAREPEPVPVRRLVHRARDGRARGHGQHVGRCHRRVHRVPDPERAAAAAEPVLRQRPGADPERHRLHPIPVPAVRDRPGRDDAAAARRPVPEPPAASASCTPRRTRTSRSRATRSGRHPNERRGHHPGRAPTPDAEVPPPRRPTSRAASAGWSPSATSTS